MNKFIIGITGSKNSGKDTVASMINYIFYSGLAKSNYNNYLTSRINIDTRFGHRVIHFADSLKDVLSILYNIDRNRFDDRESKDSLYYGINTGVFYNEVFITNNKDYKIITIEDLVYTNLSDIVDNNVNVIKCIKLRTLMQYFGTNICRNMLSKDIWIKCAMNKAIGIAESNRVCIIADVRFRNEAEVIRNASLYGGVIKVCRDKHDSNEHISEINDFDVDYTIDNNGKLINLFYKVMQVVQQIIYKANERERTI